MSLDRESPDAVTNLDLELLESEQAARLGDVTKRLHDPSNKKAAKKKAKRARTADNQEETAERRRKKKPQKGKLKCSCCGCHHFTVDDSSRCRCSKCGRLTPHKIKEKPDGTFEITDTDYDFGERSIGFRIVVKQVPESAIYIHNNRLVYDAPALLQSIFDGRIGPRPSTQSLLAMISEWDDEEKSRESSSNDCIIVDNPDDISLLVALEEQTGYGRFNFDIAAAWDREAMTGTIKIQLFLQRDCSTTYYGNTRIICCWFKLFPLDLASISGTLKAISPDYQSLGWYSTELEVAIAEHNKMVDQLRSSLSLTPTNTDIHDIVGFSSSDTSPKGVLTSFYRERLAHTRSFCRDFPSFLDAIDRSPQVLKKISNHKTGYYRAQEHDFILKYSDRVISKLCLEPALKRITNGDRYSRYSIDDGDTAQDVLACLENLGHEPELTCEGLAVELLDFQKQSLKWAMERETTPGGIQSYFWFKLPIKDIDLYFNPITTSFRASNPKEVRGGIIADEMGLGKTIVSLALILKHPAPLSPISGSDITCLSNVSDEQTSNPLAWQKSLYRQTSADNKLRGSILSRGTLVVCPISLVGQWVEEAKSKLSDPGLIYQYYGPKRTRDSKKIATNSIVVTTYQVLVKDNIHHRKKASNSDSYCPPLEQVRWWRIICDEGHLLRCPNTKQNKAISSLVADHKWIVTGTPVCKSVMDLKNQLKFVGIEDVDEMFSASSIEGTPSRKKEELIRRPEILRFLLRNIMIRHTHNQRYRGTTTTLMSLPPKSERSIEISLLDDERREYDILDKSARDYYLRLKATHGNKISSHYLLLSQKLNPQRVACSGGHPPLNPELEEEEDDDDGGGDDEELKVRTKSKKEVKYSDFCFTSKVKVLIEELEKARDEDPESKSLVFSHFISTLEFLKKELPKHGFQYRTLTGRMSMKQRAKALHDFQSDPPTTVFLLSMRAGNCGINLTQANRVFLMEPGYNPSVEKQAIGRVHRLGQKRKVEVIRLLVKDSIETRIKKFLETKHGKVWGDDSQESSNELGGEKIQVIESVGNLATETPKNKMVVSEFDLLFGVESKREGLFNYSAIWDCAMPGVAQDT